MVGARLKPSFEEEAKKRQATSTGGANPQLSANLPKAEPIHAAVKAAEAVNVSARTVEHAAKVLETGTDGRVTAAHAEAAVREHLDIVPAPAVGMPLESAVTALTTSNCGLTDRPSVQATKGEMVAMLAISVSMLADAACASGLAPWFKSVVTVRVTDDFDISATSATGADHRRNWPIIISYVAFFCLTLFPFNAPSPLDLAMPRPCIGHTGCTIPGPVQALR